ncbi:hypothetical protein GBAR_LOCUS11924 [Geodia barretti]|uniref:Dynein regulatory complex protein 12 n=1 Tax=Geodia barretti TaxID=519541 RepID=A0AA35S0P2_GEOBA|nr:hypothetical protein GBAR_LOCUS11924 [Geodia barretti]
MWALSLIKDPLNEAHLSIRNTFTSKVYCVSPHHTEETESELVGVRRERDKLRRQKEEEVSALNARLRAIERSYDAILEDALDSLCCKMEELREKWDFESREIDQRTQQTLLEFVTPG